MLIKVRRQNWDAQFSYAPPLEDALVNAHEVVSAVATESRGEGPFFRINLSDGTAMVCQGTVQRFYQDVSAAVVTEFGADLIREGKR